ncbi:tail assembly chaperone [Novosphingobium kunmingense]|uniref:Tail assembly chaperone n=1 Tax=Novosphingobium kunmingense TaxID=1211806 RepID=A0A2N0H5M0_9SPHN|nr:phage tail assembly chaperone [Novosphingobium kunmingense]PKB14235.1 tail assembly chaperone [Novosphingobium kunmingense]
MSAQPFGTGALRLSGHAAQLLGWRPAEFWQATPAELAAALAPPADAPAPLSRADLTRLMEHDHA